MNLLNGQDRLIPKVCILPLLVSPDHQKTKATTQSKKGLNLIMENGIICSNMTHCTSNHGQNPERYSF
jgi:hypothetical protein